MRPLRPAVRALVFGVDWDGRVQGAFRPGAYTARLLLRDAAGGATAAVQRVVVGSVSASPCGG